MKYRSGERPKKLDMVSRIDGEEFNLHRVLSISHWRNKIYLDSKVWIPSDSCILKKRVFSD